MLFYMWQKGTRAVAILVARCLKMHGCGRLGLYSTLCVPACFWVPLWANPPGLVRTYQTWASTSPTAWRPGELTQSSHAQSSWGRGCPLPK
jgi:hypothetical protein